MGYWPDPRQDGGRSNVEGEARPPFGYTHLQMDGFLKNKKVFYAILKKFIHD